MMTILHRVNSILIIGTLCIGLNAQAQDFPWEEYLDRKVTTPDRKPAVVDSSSSSNNTEDEYPDDPVVVESRPYVWDPDTRSLKVPPYRERRSWLGMYISGGIVLFTPQIVLDKLTIGGHPTMYSETIPTTSEVQISPRWGTKFGSLALDLAYAEYRINSTDGSGSDLTLSLPRVGLTFLLDTLAPEPYAVPYVSAGVYRGDYKQKDGVVGSQTYEGSTSIVPYFALGVLGQLNWLDKSEADQAFDEVGLENLFIFAEGRSYSSSSGSEGDPNIGSSTVLAAGVRCEF